MMKHTVNVTREDISLGVEVSCDGCPIARAISRNIPGSQVFVLGDTAIINGGWVSLPRECLEFVCRFDNGLPVAPFSFTLDLQKYPEGYKCQ